jgi:Uma2 family endonuclease
MATVAPIQVPQLPPGELAATADQRVTLHHVPWSHYEAELAVRGEKSVPRISFLDGKLEFMSPSRDHERIAAWIARLAEIFAEEHGVELSPYGSWTLKHPELAGAEPDECYIAGEDLTKERPDLVIEVVWTSGGLDKLEIYRRLGIAEVWFWIAGKITIHSLREDRYERVERSASLPGLDVDVLCSFLDSPMLSAAKRGYRAALRRR